MVTEKGFHCFRAMTKRFAVPGTEREKFGINLASFFAKYGRALIIRAKVSKQYERV
jgi:hypothetical protein